MFILDTTGGCARGASVGVCIVSRSSRGEGAGAIARGVGATCRATALASPAFLASVSAFVGRPRFFFGGCSIADAPCPNKPPDGGLGASCRPACAADASYGNGLLPPNVIDADEGDASDIREPGVALPGGSRWRA